MSYCILQIDSLVIQDNEMHSMPAYSLALCCRQMYTRKLVLMDCALDGNKLIQLGAAADEIDVTVKDGYSVVAV